MRGHKILPLLRRDASANPVVIHQKSEVNNWLPCTLWSLARTRASDWTVLKASNYAILCHSWQMTGNSSCHVDGPGQETEAEGIVTKGRRSLRVCAVQAASWQGGQRLKYTKQWKGDGRAKPPAPTPRTNHQGFPSESEGCVNTTRHAEWLPVSLCSVNTREEEFLKESSRYCVAARLFSTKI